MRSIQLATILIFSTIFSFSSLSQEDNQSGYYYEEEGYATPSQQYLHHQTYGSLPSTAPAAYDWGGTNPPPLQPSVPIEDGAAILIVAALLYSVIKVQINNRIKKKQYERYL